MNRLPGFAFVVFVVSALAYAFSVRSDTPMPPSRTDIAHLQMLDVAQGEGGRLVSVGERGNIFVSDDAGASWRQVPTPSAATLTAVRFVKGAHVLAVGHDAVILRSEDAGERWALVQSDPEAEEPLLGLWFDDGGAVGQDAFAGRGFAVGAYGRLLETADGGASWTERELEANPDALHLNSVLGVGSGVYLIAGEAGTLLRSSDGGRTWIALDAPYAGSFFGLQQMRDGAVLAFGMRGHVYRSEDLGDSWQSVETGVLSSLFGGRVLKDGRLVLVGQSGVVLVSEDHGRSFVRVQGPDRLTRAAVAAGVGDALLLIGEEGVARVSVPHVAGGAS